MSETETFPLSPVQRGVWLDAQRDPSSSAYHISARLVARQPLDLERLKETGAAICSLHPQLSISIDARGTEPMQITAPGSGIDVQHFPHTWRTNEERERAIERFRREPFSLHDGPLFRASLWDGPGGEQDLILAWHHLAADAWSFTVLLDDFVSLYYGRGEPPDRAAGYADFVRWYEARLAGPHAEADFEYWRRELSGVVPLRLLSVDHQSDEGMRGGETLPVPIPSPLAGWQEWTPFELFLSAFVVLLRAHTAQDDVSIVIPLLGRPGAAYLSVVGHFANVAVIRVDLSSTRTFRDLLAAVHRKIRGAMAHQFIPYPVLVQKLNLADPSGPVTVTDAYCGQIKLPRGLEPVPAGRPGALSLHSAEQLGSPWGLMLELIESATSSSASLRCRHEIYQAGLAHDVAVQLERILEAVRRDPDMAVTDLSWLSVEERATIRSRRSRREPGPRASPIALPRTETERALWQIWAEVLGTEALGVDDNFFAIGGRSLKAAQVIARARERFRLALPITVLFEKKTIRELAAYVDSQSIRPRYKIQRPSARPPLGGGSLLSYSQERMWFMSRLAPESAAYNIHVCLRLRREIDVASLEAAFRGVQLRHEILRTTFHETRGTPVQIVGAAPVSHLQIVDLSEMSVAEGEIEAKRTAEAAIVRPFDLEQGPLVRLMLLRLAQGQSVVVLNVHHIVADQWSLGILAREIEALYSASRRSQPAPLDPLTCQYRDYAAWQRETLTAKALDVHAPYWLDRLAGVGNLELPCDRPRPTVQTDRGAVVRHPLSAGDLRRLRALCEAHGVTPYMFFLSCFVVVLCRYTGSRDLVVGMPVANRIPPFTEALIGTFINTLALRLALEGIETFDLLLARVRDRVLEALEHQDYPFELLVQRLNPLRDPSHPPVVQVMVDTVDIPMGDTLREQLGAEPFLLGAMGVQFDLALSIDLDYVREFALYYNTDLFEAETAGRVLEHCAAVFRAALDDPKQPLSAIPMLSEVERRTIIHEWNATKRQLALDVSLPVHLARVASTRTEQTAVLFEDQRYTYGELFDRAHSYAAGIRAQLRAAGSVIGTFLSRGPRSLCSLLGIMESGAAYVPLDPTYPRARLEQMLEQSGAKAVITERALEGRIGLGRALPLFVEDLENQLPSGGCPEPPVASSPGDLAYIIYTSGSTGNPKGVEIPQRALVNLLFSMKETLGFRPDDALLAVTPLSFDISGLEMYLPLLCGGSIVMAAQEAGADPLALQDLLSAQHVTVMQATPATWRMLLEAGWSGRLRMIMSGGEAFPPELVKPLLEHCDELWNLYGPTETTIWSTAWRVTGARSPLPIGRPIANTQVHILDDRLEPVPVGAHGDIYIGGLGLARGYHGQQELTDAVFVPHPWRPGERLYRTGDRGRYLSDGTIECLGRADGQVKLHGHRIELGEVERTLNAHPAVRQAVCVAADYGAGDARLVAYCVPADPDAGLPPAADLQQHVAAALPLYMVPAVYLPLADLPLTASGKIDRRALPDPRASTRGSAQPPQTPTEEAVRAIWYEVLSASDIGVEDNFFALGGHSLSAVRLVTRINAAYGADLTLSAFFLDPTIRGVSRIVDAGGATQPKRLETDVLFPMQPKGNRPPLFLVAGVHSVEDGMYRYLANLVRHIGLHQPVYGLRPRGLVRPSPFYGGVTEMAADYVAQVRMAQPHGPYRLAGECVGGVVAYEMARQLHAAGEKVECLVLLDTEYPRPFLNGFAAVMRLLSLRAAKLLAAAGLLVCDRPRLALELSSLLARRKARLFPQTPRERKAKRFLDVRLRYLSVVRRYSVPEYPGLVHLLVNEADHLRYPFLGWRVRSGARARRGPADVVVDLVPGDHITRLTTFGSETGAVLRRILDSIAPSQRAD